MAFSLHPGRINKIAQFKEEKILDKTQPKNLES